jgi:hypothetical protein
VLRACSVKDLEWDWGSDCWIRRLLTSEGFVTLLEASGALAATVSMSGHEQKKQRRLAGARLIFGAVTKAPSRSGRDQPEKAHQNLGHAGL